jgi:HK97 family phage major capsid protein
MGTTAVSANRSAIIQEVSKLTNKTNFSREDASRAEVLLGMIDRLDAGSKVAQRYREIGDYTSSEHESQFRAYLGSGKQAISLGAVDKKYLTGTVSESIRAAQSGGTGSAGGFITPSAFSDRVQQIISQYDPIYDLAQTLTTSNGNACAYPVVDDSAVNAAIKAQNADSDLADVTFGQAALAAASTYRSGMVVAATELVTDSAFNLDNLLATTFGFRLARTIGADFTATMLADAPTAVTASSTTTITDA